MTDVVLVFMPYGTVDRPSIGLGYLAAALELVNIRTTIIHGNVLFAAKTGLKTFNFLNSSSNIDLLGEWTFAEAAFPELNASAESYFESLHKLCTAEEEAEVRRVRTLATPFISELVEHILSMKPRLVGCSSMFQQNTASLALLREIRARAPEIITVMGGANCEAEVGRALHSYFPWVDYVFSGECDELFPRFCQRLLGETESTVDQAAMPEVWPTSVFTPESRALGITRPAGLELIQNLNHLPLPSFDDYFNDVAHSGLSDVIAPAMIMETARGCWWGEKHKCTFCGLSAGTIGFRSKNADVAYREIDQLFKKYQIRHFELVDNIMDNSYYETLLPRLAEDQRKFLFFYEIKSNVTQHQVQKLADAGIAWVQPGIESLNDRLLKIMRKGNNTCHNVRLLKWSRQYGVYVMWNYLCDIPGEQDEWHQEELAMLPLLCHLQAPWNAGTSIRFDRFSTYGTHPENFGLELVPSRIYQYIYPLTPEQMQQQAYFFENLRPQVVNQGRPQPLMTQLRALMMEWRRLFYVSDGAHISEEPSINAPELRMIDGEHGVIRIEDTRPCAVQTQFELMGVTAEVYRLCDAGATVNTLLEQLSNAGYNDVTELKLNSILNTLLEAKIMLLVSGRYLSLAVQWPYRPYQSIDLTATPDSVIAAPL
jgi:ribosomal peptide maturation radical SAM protein 1